MREAIGAPLPASERFAHERELAALRAYLGIDNFRKEWNVGRSMVLEEAVAVADRL